MPGKILVVDDNRQNRFLLEHVLQYYGYEYLEACNGAEGIQMARDHMPDLILMDVQMPVMTGLDAVKILKREAATMSIPTLALTSFAANEEHLVLETGFDGYIAKPFDIRELPKILKMHLG